MRSLTGLMVLFGLLAPGCGEGDKRAHDTGHQADASAVAHADDTGGPTVADADGDGVTVEEGDCDDSDGAIYPGASEVLDDDIDQDCDGHDAITCLGDRTDADAEHCGVITGDLLIATDLVTLDGLDSLTHIGGSLSIIGNTATSLSLDNLTHVGGSLQVHSNNALTSLSLSGLTEVGVELRIDFNDSLTSFSLDSLTSIGAALLFWYNKALCQSQVDNLLEELAARGWDGADLYVHSNADC